MITHEDALNTLEEMERGLTDQLDRLTQEQALLVAGSPEDINNDLLYRDVLNKIDALRLATSCLRLQALALNYRLPAALMAD